MDAFDGATVNDSDTPGAVRDTPILESDRLILRAFTIVDVPIVERLLDTPEIAATTLNVAYPYPAGAAEGWIRSHAPAAQAGDNLNWAITLRDTGDVIGTIGLSMVSKHRRGGLGYWLGVPYWSQGYMTEAVVRVIAFAFEDLGFVRVEAGYVPTNPASGRVMEKAGMEYEGTFRSYFQQRGRPVDIEMRAIVCADTA